MLWDRDVRQIVRFPETLKALSSAALKGERKVILAGCLAGFTPSI